MEGASSNRHLLSSLSFQYDFIAIQEHWLLDYEKDKLLEWLPDFEAHIRSYDTFDPILPTHRPHGKGGVALAWNTRFSPYVTKLQDGNERIVCCSFKPPGMTPVLIVGVYLPSQRDAKALDELDDHLALMCAIIDKYKLPVIILGDFNASLSETRDKRQDRILKRFLKDNSLTLPEGMDNQSTYHHTGLGHRSQIDYILTNSSKLIHHCLVLDQCPCNTSKHSVIWGTMEIPKMPKSTNKPRRNNTKRLIWENTDTAGYQNFLDQELKSCLVTSDTCSDMLTNIVGTITRATSKFIPQKASFMGPMRRVAPAEKTAIQVSKMAHFAWKQEGCPGPEHALSKTRKQAKRQLRSVTRHLESERRETFFQEIMSSKDNTNFYKLIARQNGKKKSLAEALKVNDSLIFDTDEQLQAWADHYSELFTSHETTSSPITEEGILAILNKIHRSQPITEWEVIQAIGQLNSGKAADSNNLQAEHLKLADLEMAPVLATLFNKMASTLEVPEPMKSGILTNVPKKDKSNLLCDNYRGITVTGIIGKVLERVWKNRNDPKQSITQSEQQFGFTRGLSPSMSALFVTEAFAQAKDTKTPLYMATLDARKAFDVVNHKLLLERLMLEGIEINFLALIESWYRGLTTTIRWRGICGEPLSVGRGVRQGGVISTALYKSYINPLLMELESSGLGATSGPVKLGNPTCADDILLISTSRWELQVMLDLAHSFSIRSQYELHPTKSAITRHLPAGCIDRYSRDQHQWTIGNKIVPIKDDITHLGLQRSSFDHDNTNIKDRINLARRTVYSLMGTGLHGVNGLNPKTSIHIFKVFVLPRLLHGLEALVLTKGNIQELQKYHLDFLRHIQGLPKHTAKAAVYLMLGEIPIEGHLHLRQLTLLGQILRSSNNNIKMLALRQTATQDQKSHSWFAQTTSILVSYGLPVVADLLDLDYSKDQWKRLLYKTIMDHWHCGLVEEAVNKTTLDKMDLPMCPQIHQCWKSSKCSSRDTRKATVKGWFVCGIYNTADRLAHNGIESDASCKLCGHNVETNQHMLFECPELTDARVKPMTDFLEAIRDLVPSWLDDPTILLQAMVDSSAMGIPDSVSDRLETCSREVCFALHSRREHLLEIINIDN